MNSALAARRLYTKPIARVRGVGRTNRLTWCTLNVVRQGRSVMMRRAVARPGRIDVAFVRAARVAEIPEGLVKVVQVGDEEVALCNVAGTIFAVANVCTHDDGPLGDGYLLGDEIECPRHGARFDVRTGSVRTLPAIVPVPTFEVRIDGDDILVDVE
jgi:3-phenylpropionate/trans-cinnamate dioxygenase ferredoxin subunit